MYFWIPQRDTKVRFVAKFDGNRPLRSSRKVVWMVYHTKITRAPRDSSQPPFCQKWADRAQNYLNVVTPWLVHVYRVWSASAGFCRTYSGSSVTCSVSQLIQASNVHFQLQRIRRLPKTVTIIQITQQSQYAMVVLSSSTMQQRAIDKKLSCPRETARCFVTQNISRWITQALRTFKIISLSNAQVPISLYLVLFMRQSASNNDAQQKTKPT